MSALGQKQTFTVQTSMSALPPKADIRSAPAHVCFGPEADMMNGAQQQKTLKHFRPRVSGHYHNWN
ncbi:MAG: hypothetical protein WCC81_06645 [Pseudolabrys sp.]|jgi:hypothetical protein